ncbi:hypothetical protein [Rhodovastum atsumiense]|uniref:Lipoprotein n=1 Tax=Rhodovastum atsumiense TaxID=504468 RepID=A0A5M6IZT9_9PROT|nr:hypothetical protein [Rhodovastum atsumiense]KAA5613864.1 hypothetical protein F1189_03565 [Rhodovastum atsumiense]
MSSPRRAAMALAVLGLAAVLAGCVLPPPPPPPRHGWGHGPGYYQPPPPPPPEYGPYHGYRPPAW